MEYFYIQSYIYIFIHTYILYSVPRFTHHFEVSILNERCRVKFGRSIWFVWNLLHAGVTSNHSRLEFHLSSSEFDSKSPKHTASVTNKESILGQKQHPSSHRYFNVQRKRVWSFSTTTGRCYIPHNICRFHGLAVPRTSTVWRVRKFASPFPFGDWRLLWLQVTPGCFLKNHNLLDYLVVLSKLLTWGLFILPLGFGCIFSIHI